MSDRFDRLETPVRGLYLIQRKPVSDTRGYLERLFCAEELQELTGGKGIVQINHTLTAKPGVIRGMHFQYPPYAEIKFVSCLRGEVFDVGVDLRKGSPTFLHWHSELLSADNHKTLLIPEGCAHGFQTLTENCEMLYFHTAAYQPDAESGLNPQDPKLAIRWPLASSELSVRDAAHRFLDDSFSGLVV